MELFPVLRGSAVDFPFFYGMRGRRALRSLSWRQFFRDVRFYYAGKRLEPLLFEKWRGCAELICLSPPLFYFFVN